MIDDTQSLQNLARDFADSLRPRSFGRPTTAERLASTWTEWKVRYADWVTYRAPRLDKSIPVPIALAGALSLVILTATVTWLIASSSAVQPSADQQSIRQELNAKARERSTGAIAPAPIRAVNSRQNR